MSDRPGVADVICNAQEVKMRPAKTELSGLMNPYRGAAVGVDYHTCIKTHRHMCTQMCTTASLCLPSTALQVESIKYPKHFEGLF